MPQPLAGNPLNDTHYRLANKGLNSLANALRQIEIAESAGLDMSEFRQSHDLQKYRLEQIKAKYFPERP